MTRRQADITLPLSFSDIDAYGKQFAPAKSFRDRKFWPSQYLALIAPRV